MLPDVEGEDGFAFDSGDGLAHQRAVLIGGGADGKFLVGGDDEPSPTGAETGRAGLGEVFLEFRESAELSVDRGGEGTGRGVLIVRGQNGPEERVVGVAAGVVADAAADGVGDFAEVGDQGVNVQRGEGGVVLEQVVGVGDVGLVMLAVVDFHRLRVDVRSEGVEGVRQGREGEGHGCDLFFGLNGNAGCERKPMHRPGGASTLRCDLPGGSTPYSAARFSLKNACSISRHSVSSAPPAVSST